MRPEFVTRRLREIGARWQEDIRAAGDETKALYLPLLADAPRAGIEVVRDQAYGDHPRQVLDIYRPPGARRAPVVAFVHGGAFVRGAKNINAEMYGNVLTWFARQGCVGVNIEYRLAPEAPYPGGAADVSAACRWISRHVRSLGGDPDRLCIIGHSAGGTHVATLVCNALDDPLPIDARCAVLVSARLQADTLAANPNAAGVAAYFGPDPARYAACSPLTHAARACMPVMVANAEYENPLLDLYGLEFALALGKARGMAPPHVALPDHNHVSIMAHFNTPEQWLGEQVLAFFERSCR
ncbi:alpha/beta hydrolase [Bordetella petrii]|uniref:Alpha/beta hydrolase n=1 Tax=Bordetella petrii TaxID=94624 RepID=A0ABT7W6K0_9BORD|nr:alpha/beta hydrolase [Bordetella petrii]MDM9560819.1 alpha/beta hydrolase [Bordetella petrii]